MPEEGCLFGCLFTLFIGLIGGAIATVASFILTGPGFLAEVFLDAVVVSMLYRHLQNASRQHWLGNRRETNLELRSDHGGCVGSGRFLFGRIHSG